MNQDLQKSLFNRTELLLGADTLRRIGEKRVILFGVGGVGGWCAEALVRSGLRHLTIVDADRVSATNVNRQRVATVRTIGQVKVDALREMLLEINPEADIHAVQAVYHDDTAEGFHLAEYDYVIDAIDSLKDKASLLLRASETPAKVFSSMGAALKLDPTGIRVAEFWEVRGCPLGAALRKKMRREGKAPAQKILCVYDEEVLQNKGEETALREDLAFNKVSHNGTLAHITALFGFTLAGLVIQDICRG
ncbi:MAG: tRNA threonylcarbamoyladenosine dehydratase [Bacteroidales bacterium]|nr:tRNA threonylcarbamoyladenosine dehydratase [Bacteroidales bacterium]